MSNPASAESPRTDDPAPDRPQGPDRSRERRALTNVGGAVHLVGESRLAEVLAHALDVPTSAEAEAETRAHVHGFHTYPARMHPQTARRLVEGLSSPGSRVLDPFCGSGTVLVEARLAGRAVAGVDANPLAVRLARLKVRSVSERERTRLLEAAREVAAGADARRKARAGSSRRYGPEDVALFDPHVLLEVDGLRVALDALTGDDAAVVRADLELVLSAILTKVSRRTSDTSDRELPRRISAGYAARLFVRKAEELVEQLAAVAPTLAATPGARVREGDARVLDSIGPASIDLIVTSPPYPGVYDYLAHHDARLRWLRLHRESFERVEIGARRHLDALERDDGLLHWRTQLGEVLSAMARVLRPGAPAVLLIADSVVSGAPVYALDLLHQIAPRAGLLVRAAASQPRAHFHGPTARAFSHRPRHEHAILVNHRG